MKYLVLLLALFMVSNVNAEETYKDKYLSLSYEEKEACLKLCRLEDFPINTSNEDIDYQTNALRSFIQETVRGVPTDNEEPLDFSLSDLPLRENREDVSDAITYDKKRSAVQKVGDFVQDVGAATLGGAAQIVPSAMTVATFVPRQVNSLVGKTADALGLDSLEVATKQFENKTAYLIDDTYSGIRQGVEELTSDYGRYAKQKGFQWSDPFSDESLYVLSMYVAEFIGMAIPWVILFFVLRKYIFYKPKRAEKKNN